ncbi:MAG: KEOPS complex subunit Pcc1 [Candidatus Micrarchaeaceae archaeon]
MGKSKWAASATIAVKGSNYSKILGLGSASKYKRSITRAGVKNGSFIVEISAKDVTALRAAANAVLRDLQVASAVIPLKKKKSKSI